MKKELVDLEDLKRENQVLVKSGKLTSKDKHELKLKLKQKKDQNLEIMREKNVLKGELDNMNKEFKSIENWNRNEIKQLKYLIESIKQENDELKEKTQHLIHREESLKTESNIKTIKKKELEKAIKNMRDKFQRLLNEQENFQNKNKYLEKHINDIQTLNSGELYEIKKINMKLEHQIDTIKQRNKELMIEKEDLIIQFNQFKENGQDQKLRIKELEEILRKSYQQ